MQCRILGQKKDVSGENQIVGSLVSFTNINFLILTVVPWLCKMLTTTQESKRACVHGHATRIQSYRAHACRNAGMSGSVQENGERGENGPLLFQAAC